MRQNGFEGWYFKHQRDEDTLSFIPGQAADGAFVQMIGREGARRFSVSSFSARDDTLCAGNCCFSQYGCIIDLPGVRGRLTYHAPVLLRSDIMGPFRFLPMDCRHGVVSMAHTLMGSVTVDGKQYDFDGGRGYIEKDSGRSFPHAYLWVQCNDFTVPCAVMVSVAAVPFAGGEFTGCVGAVVYGGREYRFATYQGVRVHAANARHIRLSQGGRLLELDMEPPDAGYPLRAPVGGRMTGMVRESVNVPLHLRLWQNGEKLLELHSAHAAYEWVPRRR